jgi:cytochrome b pre-mRNA-processing protein 3
MRQEAGARSFWHLLGLDSPADKTRAEAIVAVSMAAARQPSLYGEGRTPDSFPGRFEQACLHGALAMRRLNAEPGARRLAQAYANRLFSSFDAALREVGEGDLSVAKRMKGLARAYYGRFEAYSAAMAAKDEAALAGALARNIWDSDAAPFAAPLAAYALKADAALADLPCARLDEAGVWPAFEL